MELGVLAIVGFCLAAYSVVGNDSIQTLGTFLSSNKNTDWKWIWFFVAGILVAAISWSWVVNGGDIASGRLNQIPLPAGGIQWYHVAAPAVLVFLTRFGYPVSTTFLILSVFANTTIFEKMLLKSVVGYAVAAVFAYAVWFLLTKAFDERQKIREESHRKFWKVAQWCATGFLWLQWLMHDMANIAVFLPRRLTLGQLMFVLAVFVIGLGFTLRSGGGKIQEVVLSKSGTRFARSATIVDLVYAITLLTFKEWNSVPMSTTWVFVGLLCGRELAVHSLYNGDSSSIKVVWPIIAKDFIKILVGLAVSVVLVLLVKLII